MHDALAVALGVETLDLPKNVESSSHSNSYQLSFDSTVAT
jgi:hypothetical protein